MKSATAILAIAVLVGMAGCKIVPPPTTTEGRDARRARLVEASRRSAAYADSVCGQPARQP
jgi:predicted lipoprotein